MPVSSCWGDSAGQVSLEMAKTNGLEKQKGFAWGKQKTGNQPFDTSNISNQSVRQHRHYKCKEEGPFGVRKGKNSKEYELRHYCNDTRFPYLDRGPST